MKYKILKVEEPIDEKEMERVEKSKKFSENLLRLSFAIGVYASNSITIVAFLNRAIENLEYITPFVIPIVLEVIAHVISFEGLTQAIDNIIEIYKKEEIQKDETLSGGNQK